MKDDVTISNEAKLVPIKEIIGKLGINEEHVSYYGKSIAKIDHKLTPEEEKQTDAKLILVTAITPTPFGEGKTTMSIALNDGLNRIGKKAMAALREPSLGPVLGMKGGATGGGYAQVVPKEKINLHFTGDLHAITAAHNFISAAIDNHFHFNNPLNLDKTRITWPRAMDMNDRALRSIETIYRKDSFLITAASEIMAIFSLANSIKDLRRRLDEILIGYDLSGSEVYLKSLGITDSLLIILKEAIDPNLVQTLENNPVLIHGGPFANIAHGCNSVFATKKALKLSDYVVTEAGFGADLGAQKFLDIKTKLIDKTPDVIVVVSTIRALKYHGSLKETDPMNQLRLGVSNLEAHLAHLSCYELPLVVALNEFYNDTKEEIDFMMNHLKELGYPVVRVTSFKDGSIGAEQLANTVVELSKQTSQINHTYEKKDDLFQKAKKIASRMYGANDVVYSKKAQRKLSELNGTYKDFDVVVAKTPLSFSNDPKRRGLVHEFELMIEDVRVSRGAGFVVLLTKGIITMPGLPEEPNAKKMFMDDFGNISGKI
ncbi:MAG: formate--tetrahydrofolate ligase [Paracholeplasma sp.]|nr:formate--tetrahydrofolate ligase [Paracholeplasma sp.]MDY3195691.1 formate--tetrahydrofolate ligase [Paracholeplasma sp.]